MIELLPCPFCGGEADIDQLGSRTMSCQVMCTDCGCRHESNDEGEASGKSWNRRPAQCARDELKASIPDDIRFMGWSVAVHNDYRINGVPHTFWLFTKQDRAIKGEGESDAEALDVVRSQIRGPAVISTECGGAMND